MLGRPDVGTRIDSVRLGTASSSMPPERTCDSISGSPPSWLLENTVTLSRPDDCAPIALAASVRRIVSGWVSGVLTPSLKSNSAAEAALAGWPRIAVARWRKRRRAGPGGAVSLFSLLFFSPAPLPRLGDSFGRYAAIR